MDETNIITEEKMEIKQENHLYTKEEVKRIAIIYSLYSMIFCCIIFIILLFCQLYWIKNENNKEAYSSDINKYLNIIKLYEEEYIEDIDLEKVIDYSILGVVNSLDDKYGAYIPAGNEVIGSQLVSGNYFGVGVTLSFQETFLEIVDIVENSPAGNSELKIGDCITKINGIPVSLEVYEKFRNEVNTKSIKEVKLEINNEKEIIISLGEVKEKKVEYFIENNVAYISIMTFVMDSISEFKDAIDAAVKAGATEIVFDLRDNSGGDVDAVSEMLDYILKDCLLIDMKYGNGENKQIFSDNFTALKKEIPIKILVNNNSASASELFVMALQDNYGIELIGQTTYGKSTVLKYFTFKDGSFLSMSVGTYHSKSGRYIEGVGITPDIVLSNSEIDLPIKELIKLEILN